MIKDYPEDENMVLELKGLIGAVNVLEVYEYGGFRTKLSDYINK